MVWGDDSSMTLIPAVVSIISDMTVNTAVSADKTQDLPWIDLAASLRLSRGDPVWKCDQERLFCKTGTPFCLTLIVTLYLSVCFVKFADCPRSKFVKFKSP